MAFLPTSFKNDYIKIEVVIKRLFSFLLLCAFPLIAFSQNKDYVVVLSLDGFRADYTEMYDTPNLSKIAKNGVRVKKMIPCNPTKTFANHYSLATGLYPDHHGIVLNTFYDKKMDKVYSLKNQLSIKNGLFYKGEPIWNTARKEGVISAVYNWIGSEADIQKMQPNIWKEYYKFTTLEQRVDTVINWLQLPEAERPHLVMLYHCQPDCAGHTYGPDSPEMAKIVKDIDLEVGRLYQKLMNLPIANKINFIIVSDHGMRSISRDRVIYLDKILDQSLVENIYGSNPSFIIKAKPGKKQQLYNSLKKIKHLHVFLQGSTPKALHMGVSHNFDDVILIAEKGYCVFETKDISHDFGGAHGYLNTDKQMNALFIATGKGFKKGYQQNKIRNIDVYNLIAHLLKITPAQNDGKFRRVKKLLNKQK